MSRSIPLLTAICSGILLAFFSCRQGATSTACEATDSLRQQQTDTLSLPVTDTLRGTILDASTRSIELSVVMELNDQVERHSTMEVGKDIGIVIRHDPDGTQTILSTIDLSQD